MSVNLSELFPPSGGSSGGGGGDCNIPILNSPPANPELGEQWFSSTDGYLYIWYGAEWVAIGGAGGGDGGGSGGGGGSDDPYWAQTVLMINFDGQAEGSTDIVNHAPRYSGWLEDFVFTPVGGAVVTLTDAKHGDGSLDLSPTNSWIKSSIPNNPIAVLSDDFTVEGWFKANALSTGNSNAQTLFAKWGAAGARERHYQREYRLYCCLPKP